MKFTTTRRALASALSIVGGAINTRNTIAGYNYVLLETGEDKVTFSGTDGEVSMVTPQCVANVTSPGAISLPYESLRTAVNGFDGEVVHFEVNGGTAGLKCARSERNIQGADADDFPTIPEVNGTELVIGQGQLKSMIARTIKACATEGRGVSTGLLFEIAEDKFCLTGTDGAATLCHAEYATNDSLPVSVVLPVKPLTTLCSHLVAGEGLSILFGDSKVEFRTDRFSLKTGVIDGRFPNYRAFIPDNPHKVIVSRTLFERALRSVHNVADHLEAKNCIISIGGKDIVMFSRAPGEGDVTEEIAIDTDVKAEPLTISVNSAYLLKVIESAAGNVLEIGYEGALRSLTIAEKGNAGWIGVVGPNVMPDWGKG